MEDWCHGSDTCSGSCHVKAADLYLKSSEGLQGQLTGCNYQLRHKLEPLSNKVHKQVEIYLNEGTFVKYEADSKAYRVLTSNSKIEVSRNVIFDKSMPIAADREAAKEANKITTKVSDSVSDMMPLSTPTTGDTENSDAVSLDIDLGPTYSIDSDSVASEEATQELEAAVEDTIATAASESSSAQQPEQSRYPRRGEEAAHTNLQSSCSKA